MIVSDKDFADLAACVAALTHRLTDLYCTTRSYKYCPFCGSSVEKDYYGDIDGHYKNCIDSRSNALIVKYDPDWKEPEPEWKDADGRSL